MWLPGSRLLALPKLTAQTVQTTDWRGCAKELEAATCMYIGGNNGAGCENKQLHSRVGIFHIGG